MLPRPCPAFLPASALTLAALLPLAAAHAQQIVLNNTRSLDFGSFVAASGGSITISPTGMRTRTGGVVLLNSQMAGQAGFLVARSGSEGGDMAVIISLPANGSTRLSSGANSMAVDNFVHTPSTLASVPAGGVALSVGATLSVAPNQPAGNYTGTFPLIVNFQ
ncbi:DUF4402 domain-containing protein [Massilia yuzhufengensis]|uniref:DUF4402 domain-containing protein n=1 Tax=Massilia yuzhufengensis TaxID=1164594 RepID=A0A1I1V6F5_9BURK|nr:DUF4402 domain-containing protein [Massilia yuzhufengensis]SFD77608.1 protein of unknown function [Massilia yuzhufengensis]